MSKFAQSFESLVKKVENMSQSGCGQIFASELKGLAATAKADYEEEFPEENKEESGEETGEDQ